MRLDRLAEVHPVDVHGYVRLGLHGHRVLAVRCVPGHLLDEGAKVLLAEVVREAVGVDPHRGGHLLGDRLEAPCLLVDQREELPPLLFAHRVEQPDACAGEALDRHQRVLQLVGDLRGRLGALGERVVRVGSQRDGPDPSDGYEGDERCQAKQQEPATSGGVRECRTEEKRR
jgi:hypothetical protein